MKEIAAVCFMLAASYIGITASMGSFLNRLAVSQDQCGDVILKELANPDYQTAKKKVDAGCAAYNAQAKVVDAALAPRR